jgi:serine/threonine protein kinase
MTEESQFAAALEQPPAERARFLEQACGADAALLHRLRILLAVHDRAAGVLDRPEATAEHARPEDEVGAILAGRYKLLEEIGAGGMGTVWMAEQREPVRRLAALKVIKAGMDSKAVLARFEQERQALALMDHPNIAKVLDGGTTERGRPFFVMELVKGLPLTEYCDDRRLSVAERLQLFAQVCAAVQHAHQKGILHRDLKPSNVLVTEHDGRPVPKVIDFGLAKALGTAGALTERTLHTVYGTVVGTPLYMSPEQVGINALDVDTRADVYALGVILYELLTGTTPVEKGRFKEAAWEEVKRVIREEEPPRPSLRLSSSEALPNLAARRQAEPAQLSRLVRGELDWIVLKTLEKDRNRRYETANGLAMDVQRHLAGEVVLAAPPSAAYRLRKFLRKRRGPVLAAALVLFALLAGIVPSTISTATPFFFRRRHPRGHGDHSCRRDGRKCPVKSGGSCQPSGAFPDVVGKLKSALHVHVQVRDPGGEPGAHPLGYEAIRGPHEVLVALLLDEVLDVPRPEPVGRVGQRLVVVGLLVAEPFRVGQADGCRLHVVVDAADHFPRHLGDVVEAVGEPVNQDPAEQRIVVDDVQG